MTPAYIQPKAAILGPADDAYPARLRECLGEAAPAQVCALADEIWIAYVTPGGQMDRLAQRPWVRPKCIFER